MKLLPPDTRVIRLAEPVKELGELARRNEQRVRSEIGKWESDIESFNLLLLAATHAIALGTLSRSSLSFLPAANAVARAAMEAGARAMWLLKPAEPFNREARWLAHLDGDISARARLEKGFGETGVHGSDVVRKFGADVRALLPPGVTVPAQVPKFDALLKDIEAPEKYLIYTSLSQTSHATHHGAQSFRKHLGVKKEFGDFATAEGWWLALSTTWWFLAMGLLSFKERSGVKNLDLVPMTIQTKYIHAERAFLGERSVAQPTVQADGHAPGH